MALPIAALVALLSLAAADPPPPPPAEPSFLFDLATSIGTSESTWATLAYDRKHDELFAVNGGLVHIFNTAGMETFSFGGDGDLGTVERVAVFESGEFLLLSTVNGRRAMFRCDYRGERLGTFEPKPLPEAFARFEPDRLLLAGGKVYLVETASMRVVVTDAEGVVEQTQDLAALVQKKDPDLKIGMNGFWVDGQGNLLFTLPYAFTAFVLSPAGVLRQFGTRGSSPGKFNIAGSIVTDEKGYIFVLDRLRSVVMVFDPSVRFVFEFGYRGDGPTNLVAPFDLAVGNGKVFVSQARDRGVKVFQYNFAKPAPPPPVGGRRG
jgi:hypothetical protein